MVGIFVTHVPRGAVSAVIGWVSGCAAWCGAPWGSVSVGVLAGAAFRVSVVSGGPLGNVEFDAVVEDSTMPGVDRSMCCTTAPLN